MSEHEILKHIVPEIQIEIVPEAGHLPHYEQPEIVNRVMIHLLVEGVGLKIEN